jgi:hypothetical protein
LSVFTQRAAYLPNMRSRSRGDNTSLPIIEEENPSRKPFRICGKGGEVRERERERNIEGRRRCKMERGRGRKGEKEGGGEKEREKEK